MTKHPNRPKDPNQLAKHIVDLATDEAPKKHKLKNPAAVALGKLGGIKSAEGRMDRLSAEERSAIAKKAAQARWKK